MIAKIEEIREMEGDEVGGSVIGFHLYGDVDHDDIELFMADEDLNEWFPTGVDGGWEITETYVRKVPLRDGGGYRFVYATGPGPGASKVVRLEPNHSWGFWCMNHIYEPASTSIPIEQVSNPIWPMVLARITPPERRRAHARGPQDGAAYAYLCRPCATSFHTRMAAARAAAIKELELSA